MKLKDFRVKSQLSQQNTAKLLGVSRSTYAMWETGKAQPPLNKIYLLSSALNVSVGEIVKAITGDEEF